MARIVVFRDASPEAAVTTAIELVGGMSARLVPLSYVRFDVDPGRHALRSVLSATDTLTLDLEAGSTTFVWQRVGMGAYWGDARLHLVDAVTAAAVMEKGRPVAAK